LPRPERFNVGKITGSMPDNFQRKEAIELALNKLQIKERTADGYLSRLLTSKLLDNPRSGQYEKIKK